MVRELDRALHLPAPSRCVDPTALAVDPPVPPRELAAAVDDARARLVEIDGSMRRGDFATALAQSEAAIPIAKAIGFPPLDAELALARAHARSELGPFPLAFDELRETYALTETIGYAAIATYAAAAAGSLLAVRLQDAEQASMWSKLALDAARATDDAELVIAAETTAATVEVALGHHNEARELYEGLLAPIGRTCAHPCTLAVDLEVPLAHVYDPLGNRAEATAHARRSVEIALAAYGPVHPTTADVGAVDLSLTRTQLGGALLRLGRTDQAREILDAALASEPNADSPYNLALRRYYLARTLEQHDSARAARLLTEAVRQLQGQGEEPLETECREVLARVIADANGVTPRRARTGTP